MENGYVARELVLCLDSGLIQREKTYKIITFQLLCYIILYLSFKAI